LKRVEIQDALNNSIFSEDREFVDLFIEKFKEEELMIKDKINYAFCVCRSNHVVGIVKD
jgi:Holliday junction resolvase RusA-like endonuclease